MLNNCAKFGALVHFVTIETTINLNIQLCSALKVGKPFTPFPFSYSTVLLPPASSYWSFQICCLGSYTYTIHDEISYCYNALLPTRY